MRQLELLEDTILSPPQRKVVTKRAPKRVGFEGEKNTRRGG